MAVLPTAHTHRTQPAATWHHRRPLTGASKKALEEGEMPSAGPALGPACMPTATVANNPLLLTGARKKALEKEEMPSAWLASAALPRNSASWPGADGRSCKARVGAGIRAGECRGAAPAGEGAEGRSCG